MINVKTIKRSNRAVQALELPSCMNINPRSVYNKPDELTSMILEEEVDSTFLSETWERPQFTLPDLLPDLQDDFQFITNPHARPTGRQGGRPAIIIRKDKYTIKNLTNTVVNIPWSGGHLGIYYTQRHHPRLHDQEDHPLLFLLPWTPQ